MSDLVSEDSGKRGFSRRNFLKSIGTTAVATAATQVQQAAAQLEKANSEQPLGPGVVPVKLRVNGKELNLALEPRVTLLDALRNHTDLTGAKEVCDRGTCGACTMLLDGKPIYACMLLALEAQGHEITTVEGLARDGQLSPVQQAFLEEDALMCGYCTPGFVMSVTALLRDNPHPTGEAVRHACSGNLCRCGTYPRILKAALRAGGATATSKMEVINYGDLA
jgi:aerobic-type carbon monoxide dehydrogenase small subunit (CoxS/CutS family)